MIEKKYTNLKQMPLLDGIYPPITTPFDEKGNLLLGELEKNLAVLNRFDLRGIVVLGTNGEYVMLKLKEKLDLIGAVRSLTPDDKLVIAGTGCQSTEETINLTKAAAKQGIDAALVIPPSYYRRQMTSEALINHYNIIADSSPVPIIIYNMPACTGIDLDVETLYSLSQHPNIIGLKDSSGDAIKIGMLKEVTGPEMQILAGSASFLLPALFLGASGGIVALANIAPHVCLAIRNFYLEGQHREARNLQLRMIPLNNAITATWGVPGLKAAMDIMGMYGGPVRLPLLPVPLTVKQHINSLLVQCGLKQGNTG